MREKLGWHVESWSATSVLCVVKGGKHQNHDLPEKEEMMSSLEPMEKQVATIQKALEIETTLAQVSSCLHRESLRPGNKGDVLMIHYVRTIAIMEKYLYQV